MRWTIARKLFGLSLFLITLVGVVAFAGIYGLYSVRTESAEVDRVNANLGEAFRLEAHMNELSEATIAYASTLDEANKERFEKADQEVQKSLRLLKENVRGEEATDLVIRVEASYTGFRVQAASIMNNSHIRPEDVPWIVRSLGPPRQAANDAQEAFLLFQRGRVEQYQSAAEQNALIAQGTAGSMAIMAVITGLIVSYLISRSIVRPVVEVARAAERLAAGDLAVEELKVKSRDEAGEMARSFNQMVQQLRRLMTGVSESTRQVMAAAEDLSSASNQSAQSAQGAANAMGEVAGGTARQAQAAQEVNQTIDELRQTIQHIASGANQTSIEVQQAAELLEQAVQALARMASDAGTVAEGASQAARVARAGADVVGQTVAGMERIRQVVGDSAARIKELEQVSAQIGEITTVIAEIADQTNLLALNAAIEAARAGEHGRGFAVVAEEVRRLAERSSSSTRQISGLIHSIQERTAQVVETMDTGTTEVERGSRLASEAGERLAEILVTVEKAAGDVRQVAQAAEKVQRDAGRVVEAFAAMAAVTEENTASTEEMAASANEVTDGVMAIADVAQENAAAAEEVSASLEELTAASEQVAANAHELTRIAQDLQQQVSSFKL
ncbi:MAG: methyl-accepting chemotaxis protein [Bacillota bacterium]